MFIIHFNSELLQKIAQQSLTIKLCSLLPSNHIVKKKKNTSDASSRQISRPTNKMTVCQSAGAIWWLDCPTKAGLPLPLATLCCTFPMKTLKRGWPFYYPPLNDVCQQGDFPWFLPLLLLDPLQIGSHQWVVTLLILLRWIVPPALNFKLNFSTRNRYKI